jgi:hypothetical protein
MGRWHPSSRVAIGALLVLVALDVALVGAALRPVHGGVDTGPTRVAAGEVGGAAVDGAAVDGARGSVTPRPTGSVTTDQVPLRTMLVALDDRRAWRAGAGSCADGGATVGTTTDGGRTWVKGKETLSRIVRVQPADARTAFVIGAGSSCSAVLKDTGDRGLTWATSSDVGRAWFRDPGNPAVVQAPGPSTSRPCADRQVIDLAALATGSATVLCADGRVRSTTSNGSLWNTLGTVGGAAALGASTATASQTYVARLGSADCEGVQILRVGQRVATSCIHIAIPAEPGQIAMSVTDGGGWLIIGDTTMRSTDDLATWRVS